MAIVYKCAVCGVRRDDLNDVIEHWDQVHRAEFMLGNSPLGSGLSSVVLPVEDVSENVLGDWRGGNNGEK